MLAYWLVVKIFMLIVLRAQWFLLVGTSVISKFTKLFSAREGLLPAFIVFIVLMASSLKSIFILLKERIM
jgi:hypothetical protein